MSTKTTGPIPRKRCRPFRVVMGLWCWARGEHAYRCWLAPPGTRTPTGERARRLCRCYTCGSEAADNPYVDIGR